MRELAAEAWRLHAEFADESFAVAPSAPILYFGDLDGYRRSPIKIVTVGLNPSDAEFPAKEPFLRFPTLQREHADVDTYVRALNDYFRVAPYTAWFNSWTPLLKGIDCGFEPTKTNIAIHTDLCTPLATSPTWSGLSAVDRDRLRASGVPLWHSLISSLAPDIVVMSVAWDYVGAVLIPAVSEWQSIFTTTHKKDGQPRARPFIVRGQFRLIGREARRTLFVFGEARNKPFGSVSTEDKREAGARIKEYWERHG